MNTTSSAPVISLGRDRRSYFHNGCPCARCSWLVSDAGRIAPLTDDIRATLRADVVDEMSTRGLRTIAIAFRDFVSSGLRHFAAISFILHT